jgi:hypothetical protein
MLAHGRFHSETPNVIDPGDSAPSRPSRPEKDFDNDGDDRPPQRSSSNASMSSHSSESSGRDYVYKAPLSRTIKLDYRLSADTEPGDEDSSEDDPEYGVPSRSASSSPVSSSPAESPNHEQARLYAATLLTESERRESRRNLFGRKHNERLSPVRKIWNDATRRSGDDMAPLRKAAGLEQSDGLMWGGERQTSERKSRCFNRLIVLLAVAGIFIGFGLAASSALRGRHDTVLSPRLEATINALSDAGISTRQDLTRSSTPQYQAALWISDNDPEQLGFPSTSIDSSRFVQRYVLALLYYTWEGSNWINGLQFISESHECSWFESVKDENGERFALGVACNDDLEVENLLLSK